AKIWSGKSGFCPYDASPMRPLAFAQPKIMFATAQCASSFPASLDGVTSKTPVCRFPLNRLIARKGNRYVPQDSAIARITNGVCCVDVRAGNPPLYPSLWIHRKSDRARKPDQGLDPGRTL